MTEIPRLELAKNPRLEEMAIDVMAALQKHNADLGEALDIFTNALVGVLVQYPPEAVDEVIELITEVLRRGSMERDDVTDYTDIIRQRAKPN